MKDWLPPTNRKDYTPPISKMKDIVPPIQRDLASPILRDMVPPIPGRYEAPPNPIGSFFNEVVTPGPSIAA